MSSSRLTSSQKGVSLHAAWQPASWRETPGESRIRRWKAGVAIAGGAPVLFGLMLPENRNGGAALVLLALVTLLRGVIQLLPLNKTRKNIYILLGVLLLVAAVWSTVHAHHLRGTGDTNTFWEVNWTATLAVLILAFGAAAVDCVELSEKRNNPAYRFPISGALKEQISGLNLSIDNSSISDINELLAAKLEVEIEALRGKDKIGKKGNEISEE